MLRCVWSVPILKTAALKKHSSSALIYRWHYHLVSDELCSQAPRADRNRSIESECLVFDAYEGDIWTNACMFTALFDTISSKALLSDVSSP
jgi:hypothetical protein